MSANSRKNWDCIIIGAGAAGMMCAATAGYGGASVLVVDHAPKAGAKIRISGGGKANFTNLNISPEHYICHNPHFVKSALSRYTQFDFIELVERHGVEYEEREKGKLFCKHRASDLIQLLRTECDWAGVQFQLNTPILQVQTTSEGYQMQAQQDTLYCQQLVIATGGLSSPKLKATGFGYQLAQQFGLPVRPQRPGLVPLILQSSWAEHCAQLAGISLEVSITLAGHTFQEAMLFTHHGISGPAVLQASNYWQKGEPLIINLLPNSSVLAELKQLKAHNGNLKRWLSQFWPKRFVETWLAQSPLLKPGQKLAEIKDAQLESYAQQLTQWQLFPKETAGFSKAEVTLGGIDTDAVSSKTFEAKQQPGLYFIGEVLDVTGQLGGYNFQWAWSSGVACGQAITQFQHGENR